PEPPATLRPDVPAALNALVVRLLEKDPEKRPAGAAEVAAILANPPEVEREQEQEQQQKPEQEPPRRAWLAWAAVLGLALALAGGLAAYLIQPPSKRGQIADDGLPSKDKNRDELPPPGKDGKPVPDKDPAGRKAMERAAEAAHAGAS